MPMRTPLYALKGGSSLDLSAAPGCCARAVGRVASAARRSARAESGSRRLETWSMGLSLLLKGVRYVRKGKGRGRAGAETRASLKSTAAAQPRCLWSGTIFQIPVPSQSHLVQARAAPHNFIALQI